ncbi:S-Ena type endospore appendage [Peribacillus simplex]|uniref:S-Ena type endospore appendage n=1 Tax=Peribacillus simplex TaxID=1478 RepID=UPI0011DCC9FF|nr:S-Ena type endospore appendage [Peribacillus simplex]
MICGSNEFNGACCPSARIFQEEICGNFNSDGVPGLPQIVWTAPAGDYFEGTFQIFNSAASPGNASANIAFVGGGAIGTAASPGSTVSVAVTNPTSLTIIADAGESGTYCITLYKRVLA